MFQSVEPIRIAWNINDCRWSDIGINKDLHRKIPGYRSKPRAPRKYSYTFFRASARVAAFIFRRSVEYALTRACILGARTIRQRNRRRSIIRRPTLVVASDDGNEWRMRSLNIRTLLLNVRHEQNCVEF